MSTTSLPAETRTLVEHVRWETYVALSDDRQGSVPRVTYDRGSMELMSPKKDHESIGHLLGRLIETFSEVRGIEIVGVASTTFRRADLQRGFEADQAYYVQNADRIRAKEAIDLSVDPPPDVVVEVEITNPAIAKLPLFAAMGIPEIWRHDGERLTVSRLHRDHYEEARASQALPGFPLALADSTLSRRRSVGETALVREFRLAVEGR